MRWILTCGLALGVSLSAQAAPTWPYRIVAAYAHDVHAFTEGLAICDGDLVESDGLYGASRVEIRTLHTGRVLASHALSATDFGEGVTCAGGSIVQLTWQQGLAYRYDEQLNPLRTFRYSGEGWGLTYDGLRLIESDGSATLRFFRPTDFAQTGALTVTDDGRPVTQLNELEWANGVLYANVWHDPRIAAIDPANGHVLGWLDCHALQQRYGGNLDWKGEDVLNGIAYDPDTGHLFITGKGWPAMLEVAVMRPKIQAGTARPQ